MKILTGVEIDITKSSSTDWNIFFTGGEYEAPGVIKTIGSFMLNLDSKDYTDYPAGSAWSVLYNYATSRVSLIQVGEKEPCGVVNVGGFILSSNCAIRFLKPTNSDVTYIREFTGDFDSDYNMDEV